MSRPIGIERVSIDHCIARSLDLLRNTYHARTGDDTCCGWYHYLDDPKPGVTACAVALYVFSLAGVSFERSADVVGHLRTEQVRSDDPALDGGWAVRTTHGFPLVEATAWVTRALSIPGVRSLRDAPTLERGATWLVNNQNTDYGWGSYKGCESRIFHTVLSIMALLDAGVDPTVVDNGMKWLLRAQAKDEPAWGCKPNEPVTLFHTSMALTALLRSPGQLGAAAIEDITRWIIGRLAAGVHTEPGSVVEEYEISYAVHGNKLTFANSLPQFAGPVACRALMLAGIDPHQSKLLEYIASITDAQVQDGYWTLARSPMRPSVWGIWPFIAALVAYRDRTLPVPSSRLLLLKEGAAVAWRSDVRLPSLRPIALQARMREWLVRNRVRIILRMTVAVSILLPTFLLATRSIDLVTFITTLVIPVLLLTFQILLERQEKERP